MIYITLYLSNNCDTDDNYLTSFFYICNTMQFHDMS